MSEHQEPMGNWKLFVLAAFFPVAVWLAVLLLAFFMNREEEKHVLGINRRMAGEYAFCRMDAGHVGDDGR